MAYINEGNGPALFGVNIAAIVLTTGFFVTRMYVRCFMVKIWKIEDWLFLWTQIIFIIFMACSTLATIHGNGQHLTTIKPADLPIAMQYWYISSVFYITVVCFMRLSIGFFLLRIASSGKRYVYTIYGTMGAVIAISIAFLFFLIFQCSPAQYFWLQFEGGPGHCIPGLIIQNVTIFHSVVGACADFVFSILPIFLIMNLKMNRRTKVAAGILLSLGFLAGLTVLVRIVYIKRVVISDDFLFAACDVALFGTLEPTVGICCAAAATLRPLFKSLQDRTRMYGSKTAGTSNQRSLTGKRKSDFQQMPSARSAVRAGYLKSVDTKNASSDEIPLASVSNKIHSPTDTSREEMRGGENGIYLSRTVEVSRQERGSDLV